jgi:8-oxo-dGTP diphosphatase
MTSLTVDVGTPMTMADQLPLSDEAFLAQYDPSAYARPSVTVDVVLLSAGEKHITTLLSQRQMPPFHGHWALPGTFVRMEETVEATAQRVLRERIGLPGAYLEQLYTFGAVDRDPRTRVITIAYCALVTKERLAEVQRDQPTLVIGKLDMQWAGETGGPVITVDEDGRALPLAFDHAAILGYAVKRIRGKLDYAPIAFAFLPETFTLRAVQAVYEVILGRNLNKPAFRRRMLDTGWIEPTGAREDAAAFRPAELYRLKATVTAPHITGI